MKKSNPYKGVIVPIVTPLNDDYSIDKKGLVNIVRSLLDSGASPFIAGTTGEGSSLSFRQKEILVEETVRQVAGKALVYAGITACQNRQKQPIVLPIWAPMCW